MALTAKKVYAILKRQISNMEAKLNSPIRYRGTVATADLLPLNPDIGDMYNIESKSVYGEAGMNVAWNGVVWDTMGAPIDMSLYIKSSELADWVKQQNKPTYTAEEVGALPADTKIPSKTSDLQNDSGFLTKIPDNYLSGTDKTLSVSGKAADAKATGEKFTEMSADISKKLDKNQGSENSGKIAGINEAGDIVPMFPMGVEYNSETNCLEFGSDQKMELNQGIGLDSTLTKTGFAADAGVTGKEIDSLKESISTKITKFYASSQGETHLADSDDGKIMDMMVYGKSEQKQYLGKNLLNPTFKTDTYSGVTLTNNGDGTYTIKGTNSSSGELIFSLVPTVDEQKTLYNSLIGKKVKFIIESGSTISGSVGRICFVFYNETEIKYSNETYNGGDVTVPTGYDLAVVDIHINVGQTIPETIIKPMLTTDLTATYDDFEPYTGGIPSPNPDYPQEIKSVVNPTVKVCGKNLLNPTLQSTTQNGITCTNNGDGTYTLNGTAIQNAFFSLRNDNALQNEKRYKITGCPSGSDGEIYMLRPRLNDDSIKDTGNGAIFIYLSEEKDNFAFVIRINKGFTCNNLLFKPMIVDVSLYPDATYDDFEPYHEQTVTLPYTLNAIPVSSGGNVTIGGQQYIADYVDVERGKLVRRVLKFDPSLLSVRMKDDEKTLFTYDKFDNNNMYKKTHGEIIAECSHLKVMQNTAIGAEQEFKRGVHVSFYAVENNQNNNNVIYVCVPLVCGTTASEFLEWANKNAFEIIYKLATPTEIDLTPEEVQAFKALATYYPTTNISVNSEQLDGYTVLNYPISMENGWNYVKQQIGDTRDYIYDMDARTQDTDLQAAEAYVNSEYAVALTELEV